MDGPLRSELGQSAQQAWETPRGAGVTSCGWDLHSTRHQHAEDSLATGARSTATQTAQLVRPGVMPAFLVVVRKIDGPERSNLISIARLFDSPRP